MLNLGIVSCLTSQTIQTKLICFSYLANHDKDKHFFILVYLKHLHLLLIQNGKPAANASLVGGENEALQRLRKFAAECQAQPNKENKDGTTDSIYGANFSCKISPWLAMGCLSPRSMFDELKKSTSRYCLINSLILILILKSMRLV